jgi:hypothetical protein
VVKGPGSVGCAVFAAACWAPSDAVVGAATASDVAMAIERIVECFISVKSSYDGALTARPKLPHARGAR